MVITITSRKENLPGSRPNLYPLFLLVTTQKKVKQQKTKARDKKKESLKRAVHFLVSICHPQLFLNT